MPTIRDFENHRSTFAFKKVNELSTSKKEYKNAVNSLIAMIYRCGLSPTIAFYNSKSEYTTLLNHIKEWFATERKDYLKNPINTNTNFFQYLHENVDMTDYRFLTRDTLYLLQRLKNMSSALVD